MYITHITGFFQLTASRHSVSSHGMARCDLSKVKKLLHNRKVSTVLIYSASIFPSSVSGSKTAITAHT